MKTRQFIKLISIFILLFGGTSFLYGQSNNQSLLTNKEWIYRMPNQSFHFITLFPVLQCSVLSQKISLIVLLL